MKTEPTIMPDSIAESSPKPRPLAGWGLPTLVFAIGAVALAIVWMDGPALGGGIHRPKEDHQPVDYRRNVRHCAAACVRVSSRRL